MLRAALFAARSASARGSAPAVARGLRWGALCPVVGAAAGRHWPLQAGWGMLSGGQPRAFSEAKAGDGAFLPSMSSPGSQADLMDEVRTSAAAEPTPTHAGCSLPTWQGEYRGLVDMTLENIEDVVNEMCDEVPGFDSTLAVRAPSPHPPRHARTLTLLHAPAVARRVAVGVARTECSASTWGISALLC